jgi:hypothetical protein
MRTEVDDDVDAGRAQDRVDVGNRFGGLDQHPAGQTRSDRASGVAVGSL